jgi:hypothetical protein
MSQDHSKIHQGFCSVLQAAPTGTTETTGTESTGVTAGGATTGCTAGGATGRRTAPGRTPGRLRKGLSPLGRVPGLPLGLVSAFTKLGLLRRLGRPRPGLRGRGTGGFTSEFCGSASTTQARATRAKSTCKNREQDISLTYRTVLFFA